MKTKRHPALPQSMTIEQLAQWLTENAVEKNFDIKEIPLTEAEKIDHEHRIANATAAIYDLQALERAFKKRIKKGTNCHPGEKPGDDVVYEPEAFTIPPTKGTDSLEENRKFSDAILKAGKTIVETQLYGIPYSDTQEIVFFDIEGNEFANKNRPMTAEQKKAYVTDLFSA